MSEPLSDADKIRNKRLAKLQQTQPTSQAEGESTTQAEGAPDGPSVPEITNNNVASSIPSQSSAPSALSNPTPPASSTTSRIRITPNITPQKREMNGSQRSSSRPTDPPKPQEPVEQWEDRVLKSIFRLTFDPSQSRDQNGHELRPLPELVKELESENQEVRLRVDMLEQAIMEAGANPEKVPAHQWLFPCWKRVQKISKSIKEKVPENKRWEIISEAKRLCFSWCILSITTPEVFQAEYDGGKAFADHMLNDPDDDQGVCNDFVTEALVRWSDDDAIATAFVSAIEELSRRLAAITMDGDYRPYMSIIRRLVIFKPVCIAITESAMFCDKSIPAAELEARTILGPFFQLSPLQAQVTSSYFPGPKTMDPGRIKNAQQALQMSLRTHQQELYDIIYPIMRASTEARERLLDWFALIVNANHKRTALRVDKKTVSSDGFMINVNACLDQLSEPFMDATFSKVDRAELEYFRRNPRVDIKEETKMNADQEESDKFYSEQLPGQNNFISEIFFLTVAAHHYGLESTRKTVKELERDLKHMEKQLEVFEADRTKYLANPMQLRQYEIALQKYKDQLDKGLSYKHAVQGILNDELAQTRSMQFMRFVTVWLLRQMSGVPYPQKTVSLPLPPQSPAIKCLPEYFIDIISGNFGFILYNLPQIISSTQSDELIILCIALLEMSEFIKNPYLKGSLITVLFRGTWVYRHGAPGILANQYNSLKFATDHMLHALMKFFIEAEFMGGHGQFYDKFNVRYEIFQIIKCIWPNTVYRAKLLEEAKGNLDFFVRFVNLLLNDVTFVLDESFTAFHTIYDLTKELATSGTTITQEERTTKEEALEAAKGKAKSYMQLTNETVSMLKLFTEALGNAFSMPEVVQRLADMLDYNLDAMVPPKSSSLKVDNLREYNFDPKTLLSEIVDVYLNLSNQENFILAVARDGRSYKPQNFRAARQIMQSKVLKAPEEIARWDQLVEKFAKVKEEDEAADADLGEIPEEFLDPLMYTLMEDPVQLPTSKTIIDRSTIRSHLLSDPNDPFNRVPLKIEDVVPATEMKARIDQFKQEKLGGKKKGFVETVQVESTGGDLVAGVHVEGSSVNPDHPDVMDTSA